MIIGLTGYAQTGKDTFAQVLVQDHGYHRFAFADALKDVALAIDPWVEIPYHGFRRLAYVVQDLGWDGAKAYPDVRTFLQKLGHGMREHTYHGVWLYTVSNQIRDRRIENAVITDVRYKNEAEWVRTVGKLVRIERPGVGPVNGHRSESELAGTTVDYEFNNDGDLDDLRDEAQLMLEVFEPLAKVIDLTAARYGRRRRRA